MEQQETLPYSEENNNEIKSTKIKEIVLSSISLSIMVLTVCMYIFGAIKYDDESLNPISAFNFILQIFNINKYIVYDVLSGLVIGVIYFTMLGFIVKSTIKAVTKFKAILKEKDSQMNISRLNQNISEIFISYFTILILSSMAKPFTTSVTTTIIVITMIIFFVFKQITTDLLAKISIVEMLNNAFGALVLILLTALLSKLMVTTCVYDLVEGISTLSYTIKYSNDLSAKEVIFFLYHYVGKYILYIVVAVNYIIIMKKTIISKASIKIYYKELLKKYIFTVIFVFVFMLMESFMENNLFQKEITFTSSMLIEWVRLSKTTFVANIITLLSGIVLLCSPLYSNQND